VRELDCLSEIHAGFSQDFRLQFCTVKTEGREVQMSRAMIEVLFDALREDHWRRAHSFSEDIQQAHRLMHHPFVAEDEIAETVRLWFEKRQPCLFGRYAAKRGAIHICVLTERDLQDGEKHLKAKLAEEKRLWKQRALDTQNPEHSFSLVVVSQRVALAAPDDNLERFATRIRELTGWKPSEETNAPVASDFLYLKSPHDPFYYGFKFNLDFFAAAGDGRWWHDHRVPGGIAFTANSTGHMKQFQEWYAYKDEPDRGDWILRLAMQTISLAHTVARKSDVASVTGEPPAPTPPADPKTEGRITWLLDLVDGKPKKAIACPFKGPILHVLQGKDWTTYAGLIHTDHNIRKEFFEDREIPSSSARPYLNDFTYLFAQNEGDYVKFTAGVRVGESDVYKETGSPNTWKTRGAERVQPSRTPEQAATVRRLLAVCRRWEDDPQANSAAI